MMPAALVFKRSVAALGAMAAAGDGESGGICVPELMIGR